MRGTIITCDLLPLPLLPLPDAPERPGPHGGASAVALPGQDVQQGVALRVQPLQEVELVVPVSLDLVHELGEQPVVAGRGGEGEGRGGGVEGGQAVILRVLSKIMNDSYCFLFCGEKEFFCHHKGFLIPVVHSLKKREGIFYYRFVESKLLMTWSSFAYLSRTATASVRLGSSEANLFA